MKTSRINITGAGKKSKLYVARRSINPVANHLKFFPIIFKDHLLTSYCVGSTKSNATPSVKPSEHRLNRRLSAGLRLARQLTRDKGGRRDEPLRRSAWEARARTHNSGVGDRGT